MKASVKFRDDQKPLVRVKIPLRIVGLPFQSSVAAGDADDLTLNISTAFGSGPFLRLSYRPNDSANPFSLSLKTRYGPFGSPLASSLSLSAHFNLHHHRRNGTNPAFTIHLGQDVVYMPASVTGLFSGIEVGARSALSVMGRAVVSFRLGVRVPVERGSLNSLSLTRFPFLVMNKIGIEHKPKESDKVGKKVDDCKENTDCKPGVGAEVAEGWYLMRRQLDMLKEENGELRKVVDDLRREFASMRGSSDRWVSNTDRESSSAGCSGKGIEGDMNEESKKVLKGAS